MTTDWRRIAWIAGILALAAFGYAIWHAGSDIVTPPGSQEAVIRHGRAQGRRADYKSWSFVYDKLTTGPDKTTQTLEGVHDGVYYKKGVPVARLRAKRIIANQVTDDFTIAGDVHIDVDDKGKTRTFDTDRGTWTNLSQTLQLPGTVLVGSEGGARIQLQNLSMNLTTGEVKVGRMAGGVTP